MCLFVLFDRVLCVRVIRNAWKCSAGQTDFDLKWFETKTHSSMYQTKQKKKATLTTMSTTILLVDAATATAAARINMNKKKSERNRTFESNKNENFHYTILFAFFSSKLDKKRWQMTEWWRWKRRQRRGNSRSVMYVTFSVRFDASSLYVLRFAFMPYFSVCSAFIHFNFCFVFFFCSSRSLSSSLFQKIYEQKQRVKDYFCWIFLAILFTRSSLTCAKYKFDAIVRRASKRRIKRVHKFQTHTHSHTYNRWARTLTQKTSEKRGYAEVNDLPERKLCTYGKRCAVAQERQTRLLFCIKA